MTAVVAAGLATVFATTAVAAGVFSSSPESAGALLKSAKLTATDSTSPTPALVGDFSLFSEAKTQGAVPTYLQSAKETNGPLSNVDYADAQQVQIANGQTVTIVPGGGFVCFVHPMPSEHGAEPVGADCQTEALTEAGRLSVSEVGAGGEETIYGLAPNGDTEVTIGLANGATATVDVKDSVYSYVGHGIVRISLKGVQPSLVFSGEPAAG